LTSGAGVEKFRDVIAHQGGDPRVVDDYTRLPSAPDRTEVPASRGGYVSALRAEQIGRAAVALGAGRGRLDDAIDPGVGIEVVARVGDRVAKGDPILTVHHRGGTGLEEAQARLSGAIDIGDLAPLTRPIVVARVSGESA
jgi:pyrimidine-nucleoside phosphorylase